MRIEGDEFGLILDQITVPMANAPVNHLQEVGQRPILWSAGYVRVCASDCQLSTAWNA